MPATVEKDISLGHNRNKPPFFSWRSGGLPAAYRETVGISPRSWFKSTVEGFPSSLASGKFRHKCWRVKVGRQGGFNLQFGAVLHDTRDGQQKDHHIFYNAEEPQSMAFKRSGRPYSTSNPMSPKS